MADTVSSKTQHIAALDFDITKAQQQLDELKREINDLTEKISSQNWTIKAVLDEKSDVSQYGKKLQEAQDKVVELEDHIEQLSATGVQSTNVLAGIIEAQLVNALKDVAVAAKDAAQDVEDSMMAIQRVLGTTAAQTASMKDEIFDLGNSYGRSFQDVSDITLRYVQAGYNMNDSLKLTQSALLGINTAEMTAEQASTSMIGILNQWGYEADELTTIIDKLNYTADHNAITTSDLIDALLKASSVAKTSGMSFNDTVGTLTALKVASGAAGKEVGNAFKSILSYIQRPDSLKTFDNMGIDVFKDKVTGELLPMMEILTNMSKKWNTNQEEMLNTFIKSGDTLQMMSEEWAIATDSMEEYEQYQNAVTEATDKANDAESRAQAQAAAGVFRRNYYISLMEKLVQATEVSKDLMNSEGWSAQQNSLYMETLSAKIEQLVSSLTELAVAAADSGLMDLAKSAIDTATAFTQWTTESKNLAPILSTIVGFFVTLKAQKIADEFKAILSSFGNVSKAFLNVSGTIEKGSEQILQMTTISQNSSIKMTTNLKNIETSAVGATTAATGLSAAIGGIGLAISAISIVVTIVNSITSAIRAGHEEAINAGKEANDRLNNLEELKKKYDELKSVTDKTTSQENEYKEVQKDIVKLLGERADKLKYLKEGTEEYTKALENLIIEESKANQATLVEATESAKKEMNWDLLFDDSVYVTYNSKNPDPVSQVLYNKGVISEGSSNITFGGIGANVDAAGATRRYSELKVAMEALNDEYNRLLDAKKIDEANELISNDNYKKIAKNYEDTAKKVDVYVESLVAQKENEFRIQNAIPKTYEEQQKMNDAVFEATGLTEDYKEQVLGLTTQYYTATQARTDFEATFNSDEFAKEREELNNLSNAGKLNATTFEYTSAAHGKLAETMKEYGISAQNIVDVINGVSTAAETSTEQLGLTEEELKSLATTISDSESNISSLNKIMQTLTEGNSLTAEQVMELCDTYGLLASQFTETENGYKIEVSALETLRNAQIEAAKTAKIQQAENTYLVATNVMQRIEAYGLEIDSITNIATAEAALIKLEGERAKLAYSINSAYDQKEKQGKVSEIDDIIGNVEKLRNSYENIEAAADDFYTKIGQTSASKTDDTFKNLINSINRLGEMGVYTTTELIDKFEEMRHTAGYTTKQIQALEDELHKLYSSQVEENLKATEEEYKNHIQAIKDKYDLDKEELEKYLDEEKEAFKEAQDDEMDARKEYWNDEIDKLKDNLNAQIDASKKAYESKKKLTEKSYEGQIEALESLKDNELDNIKSVYNAQIDALNKIKAARNAERDEEDYQDERAGLLEQLSYWEQRTGTDAVENIANIKKQISDLDRERKRELEDDDIDNQIDTLEEQRDAALTATEKAYDAQLAALKASKTSELEIYETTYNAEQEMLQSKLDKDVAAMEKARDADIKLLEKKQKSALKLLEEEQEKKLKDLEEEKEAAIKAADEKWAEIEKIFTDYNQAMISSAAMFAPELYNQFHTLFTERFKMDLDEIKSVISQMDGAVSNASSGVTPTGSHANSSGYTSNNNSRGSSSSGNSSSGFKTGSSVKVSGTVYSDSSGKTPRVTVSGEKTTITSVSASAAKPYKVGNMGWVDSSSLVKARTGGLTKADGIAMLHKDELIINPELVKGLKAIVDPKMIASFQKAFQPESYGNVSNTYNNSRNYNNGGKSIVQNFNAPLQNIEKIEDNSDMEAATNSLERKLMRNINRMM